MLACLYDYSREKSNIIYLLELRATKMAPTMNTTVILFLNLIMQTGLNTIKTR
jgi:hypothetical protein